MTYAKLFLGTLLGFCLLGFGGYSYHTNIRGNLKVFTDYEFRHASNSQFLKRGEYDGNFYIYKDCLQLQLDLVIDPGWLWNDYAEIHADMPPFRTWVNEDGEHKYYSAEEIATNFDLQVVKRIEYTRQHVSTTENCTLTEIQNDYHKTGQPFDDRHRLTRTTTRKTPGFKVVEYDLIKTYEDYNVGFFMPNDPGYLLAEFRGSVVNSHRENTVTGACTPRETYVAPPLMEEIPRQEVHHYYFSQEPEPVATQVTTYKRTVRQIH